MLYGTSAFIGKALDDHGNLLPGEVAYGVFRTNAGTNFFGPIAFIPALGEGLTGNLASFKMDLAPIIPTGAAGPISGTAFIFIAMPEPGSLPLLLIGLPAIAFMIFRHRKSARIRIGLSLGNCASTAA